MKEQSKHSPKAENVRRSRKLNSLSESLLGHEKQILKSDQDDGSKNRFSRGTKSPSRGSSTMHSSSKYSYINKFSLC